jgi:hypothetical protein
VLLGDEERDKVPADGSGCAGQEYLHGAPFCHVVVGGGTPTLFTQSPLSK